MEKLNLRQYSSFDLLVMAITAVEKDLTAPKDFKTFFGVDFTFLQLCSLLTRRKIWNKPVFTSEEYEIITSEPDKETLVYLLDKVKSRNKVTISNFEY